MRKYLVILFILGAMPALAQDLPDLSNYQHNWMIYNAAFTGSRDAGSISTFLRQKEFSGPGPMYQQLSAHTPLKNEKLALGVNWFSEQNAGTLFGEDRVPSPFRKSSLFVNYAYRIWAGGGRLSFGISGGLTTYVEKFGELTMTDPQDPIYMSNEREFLPNFGAGVLYYVDNRDRKYFVGLSVPYFLTRGNSRNSIRHDFNSYTGVLTGGYRFKINQVFSIFPTGLTMYEVGTNAMGFQSSLNLGFIEDKFTLGAIMKVSKVLEKENEPTTAVAINANFEISRRFMIGYSYDYYLNSVSSFFNDSHEIVLRYEFRKSVASSVPFYY